MVPGLLAVAFLVVPLLALLLQAPWGSFTAIVSTPEARDALRLSLLTSVSATAVAAVLGIPLAWLLAQKPWIAPIPGTFAGTVGRSAFWLMDAAHPPAAFDGETVRIHWATFDEARSLFELTETPAGRARDHAILTATERVLQGLPHDQRPALQPQDAKLRETTRQRGERPQGQRSNELSSYA